MQKLHLHCHCADALCEAGESVSPLRRIRHSRATSPGKESGGDLPSSGGPCGSNTRAGVINTNPIAANAMATCVEKLVPLVPVLFANS